MKKKYLTEEQLHEPGRKLAHIVLPIMLIAVAMLFLYFLVVGYFRDALLITVRNEMGASAADIAFALMPLPAIPIFLVPVVMAERYCKRHFPFEPCPACRHELKGQDVEFAHTTRSCLYCGERILEGGKVRSRAVYKRWRRRQESRTTSLFLWLHPGLILLAIILNWWIPADRSAERGLSLAFMLGLFIPGYAWIRSRGQRFLPHFLTSLALILLFAWLNLASFQNFFRDIMNGYRAMFR